MIYLHLEELVVRPELMVGSPFGRHCVYGPGLPGLNAHRLVDSRMLALSTLVGSMVLRHPGVG